MTAHGTHCCKIHGCKYEDEDCPVVLGTEQGIQCEECLGALRVMEDDPLFGLEAMKRQLEQANVNTRWLISIIDQTHELLCPEHTGTWQQRAEQVLRFARRYAGKQVEEE